LNTRPVFLNALAGSAILALRNLLRRVCRLPAKPFAGYYGGQVDAERIIVTASTSEAYGFIFKLLADPGDEVLVPRRHIRYSILSGAGFCSRGELSAGVSRMLVGRFRVLASRITARTRAIVLVNPNNPTGSFLKKAELARLVEICRRRDIALVSDEVFFRLWV